MIPKYVLATGQALPERISSRTQLDDLAVQETVLRILRDVKENGDAAVLRYNKELDAADMTADELRVTGDEVNDAYKKVTPGTVASMRRAVENIRAYHEKQKRQSWMDFGKRTLLGQLILPIENVGIYVPGGSAPLFSSVMMNALPAVVAGVGRIVMATPPRADGTAAPEILIAAYECGVKEIYKVGGAQAIGAMAYGTESIASVDKIVGPGNVYVANAKREVFGKVGIDMIAGPSEILVVADASAKPAWIAADMLSQAEHDPLAAAYLITDCESVADAVIEELEKQLNGLPRADIARESLSAHGAVMLVADMPVAMEFANKIAPEHLELCVENPGGLLGWVRNAGACFMGHTTPEPLGDYYAGPNHVLPTSGTARFFSPLSVDDFVKKTSVIRYSTMALAGAAQDVTALARAEGLEAHARAVEIRLKETREKDQLRGEAP